MIRKMKDEYEIQSVSAALTLLEQFRIAQGELSLSELCRQLHLSKNKVFRLLVTLESRDYIEKNSSTGKYRLGMKTLKLSQSYMGNKYLVAEGRSFLKGLASRCHETVFLATLSANNVVLADVVETVSPIRIVTPLGTSFPLHCTAAGKVMLAHGGERVGGYLKTKSLRQYSERTITSPAVLHKHLEEIRSQGYSLEVGEYEPCLCGVAAPIRDYSESVVAAVSIIVPQYRIDQNRLTDEFAPLVVKASHEISSRMGYLGPW